MTMTLIQTVTVGSGGAASINFTSIPATYTDLQILLSQRRSDGATGTWITFNSDTGGNYNARRLRGDGSSAFSTVASNESNIIIFPMPTQGSDTANTFSNISYSIPNYAGSTQKSLSIDAVGEDFDATANQFIIAGLWTGTAAITSIQLNTAFYENSSASLYGILKGSGGATVS